MKQDGSRMIVVCEMHGCLLGKVLNLYTSQIASDAIWNKISKHFDDTYLRSVTCKKLMPYSI